jgi:hypothetical protein
MLLAIVMFVAMCPVFYWAYCEYKEQEKEEDEK